MSFGHGVSVRKRSASISTDMNPLPSGEALPDAGDFIGFIQHVIPIELRGGGAGVIRQYADMRTDGKIGQPFGRPGPQRDDSMFLIDPRNDEAGIGRAGEIADHSIALVESLVSSTAILRQRSPTGVDEDPAFFALMPDDSGQH